MAVCCWVFLFWCTPAKAQAPGGSIVGQVRVSPGTELPKPVMVTLQGRGAVINSVYTDGEGRFGFNGLPGNVYHVVIEEKEYLPVSEQVVVDPESAPIRMVNIFLSSRNFEKAAPPGLAGGNPNLTNVGGSAKTFPKNAVKEFKAGLRDDNHHRNDEAIKHYLKAIAIAPDYYPAHNNLGIAYLSKGMYDAAEAQFYQAINFNPSDAAAYLNLGNLYFLQRHYEDARSWVQQGLSKEPDSAFGHFLGGSISTAEGDFGQAEQDLRRSLALDAKLAKAHLALVNLYLRQQRPQDASVELRAFLKDSPDDPMAPKAREMLKRIESEAASSKPKP